MNSQHTSSIQKNREELGNKGEKMHCTWTNNSKQMVRGTKISHAMFLETLTYRSDSHDELLTVSPRNWRRGNPFKSQTGSLIHYSKKKIFFKSTHSKRSLIMLLCLWEDVLVLVHARSVDTEILTCTSCAQIPVLWNSDRSKPHWNL